MGSKSLLIVILVVGSIVSCPARLLAEEPAPASVGEIQSRHDRALIRELGEYLIRKPQADDREQAYAALFNKVIEHDWFPENETTALRYLKENPEGPVKSLAQIIGIMARAQSGRYDEALARYKDLMLGLGRTEQEEFASSFAETFATSAIAGGEFAIARQAFQTLAERFPDSSTIRQKLTQELARLDKVGKPAPDFSAQDLQGKTVKLESLRGKYVLVDFWATWCAPCITELPRLQEAYRKHHEKGLEIVSVSLDETRGVLVDFVNVRKLPWNQVHNSTSGSDLVEAFGVSSIPASYLIDPNGTVIRLDLRGPVLDSTLDRLVRSK